MSDPAAKPRSAWRTFGIVVGVVVGVAGLAFVACIIVFMAAMANYGSNK